MNSALIDISDLEDSVEHTVSIALLGQSNTVDNTTEVWVVDFNTHQFVSEPSTNLMIVCAMMVLIIVARKRLRKTTRE